MTGLPTHFPSALLEDAHLLPKAHYLSLEESGVEPKQGAMIEMNFRGYSGNKGEFTSIGTYKLGGCLAMFLWNREMGSAVAHASEQPERALREMVKDCGTTQDLTLDIIGGVEAFPNNPQRMRQWEEEKASLLALVKTIPQLHLRIFDVGTKPHPTALAQRASDGALIRLSPDVSTIEDIERQPDRQPIAAMPGGWRHFGDLFETGIPHRTALDPRADIYETTRLEGRSDMPHTTLSKRPHTREVRR